MIIENSKIHNPVLLKEVLEIFDPQPGQIYIDATVNGGGHTEAILERIGSKGKLLGIDWDCDLVRELEIKNRKLKIKNFEVVCDNYTKIISVARRFKTMNTDGILFDLGFSSYHIERSGRGFSFLRDEPLDMRYSSTMNVLTAEEIVNTWPVDDLEKIFHEYGEERFARRIARAIVQERQKHRIRKTGELVKIIVWSIPLRAKMIHPATRIFQALRIAVNRELENLSSALEDAFGLLKREGKMVCISFHSLEDRQVKEFFRRKEKGGTCALITKKPLVASREEIMANPRARSAKLRAAIKI